MDGEWRQEVVFKPVFFGQPLYIFVVKSINTDEYS